MNNGNTITKSQLSKLVASLDERFEALDKSLAGLHRLADQQGGYEEMKALSEGVASLQGDFDKLAGRLTRSETALAALESRVAAVEGVAKGLAAVNAAIASMTREIEAVKSKSAE